MLKLPTHYILFIALFFLMPGANAQFVGYYNLHDGGVDMPNSSLIILPKNEFLVFYYGGMKAGKWVQTDKNSITLEEVKANSNAFTIYGKTNRNPEKIRIDVDGLANADALIFFSNDTVTKKKLQPVFNDFPNCMKNTYPIYKKTGEYKWVTIIIPANPDFRQNGIRYPYKALSYTFALEKNTNDYIVIQNEEGLKEPLALKLTKNNETYSIGNSKVLEREDLTDELLKKIAGAKLYAERENNRWKLGAVIPFARVEKINIYEKPALKPIFIAKCAGNDTETVETIEKINLPTADRINGFYRVLNFKENDYDVKKYELAKSPSLQQEDIRAVNKVVSAHGGYEIEMVFTDKGNLKLKELSKSNIGKPVAIVINKKIVSAPVLYSAIAGGKVIISGGLSETEIDELIADLKK